MNDFLSHNGLMSGCSIISSTVFDDDIEKLKSTIENFIFNKICTDNDSDFYNVSNEMRVLKQLKEYIKNRITDLHNMQTACPYSSVVQKRRQYQIQQYERGKADEKEKS